MSKCFCSSGEGGGAGVSSPSRSNSLSISIAIDRKSTRLNSSHSQISYAVFCLKKKNDALPYVLAEQPVPVHDQPLPLCFVRERLREPGISAPLATYTSQPCRVGPFRV